MLLLSCLFSPKPNFWNRHDWAINFLCLFIYSLYKCSKYILTFINVASFASKPRVAMTNKAVFITTSRLTIPIVLTGHMCTLKYVANHYNRKFVLKEDWIYFRLTGPCNTATLRRLAHLIHIIFSRYVSIDYSSSLRGHSWVHFAHRLQCTITLNSNFAIWKTWNYFQLE